MPARKDPADCLIVIFGASGDLTKRKLIPAVYDLFVEGRAPRNFGILGISRSEYTDDSFRDEVHDFDAEGYDEGKWNDFAPRVHYFSADATKGKDWPAITDAIRKAADEHETGQNIMFYLSLAPQFFEPVITHIGDSGLVTEGRQYCSIGEPTQRPWQRIVVEKPFGSDPKTARHLNDTLAQTFDEEAIYRIDHYLGKELVQNLLVTRFANIIFEPIWNSNYIDHVQITASETVGVEGRGSYYDSPSGGALRDMVQSHLLQVLSLVAMEPPVLMDAADIRTEKIKVFKALRVPRKEEVPQIAVRGQYGAGEVDGEQTPDYRDEKGVKRDSQTDTYAAVMLHVDTWRWGGVPFYLRSGKAMPKKLTRDRDRPSSPRRTVCFREQQCDLASLISIIINVQPDEGIRLRVRGKGAGHGSEHRNMWRWTLTMLSSGRKSRPMRMRCSCTT